MKTVIPERKQTMIKGKCSLIGMILALGMSFLSISLARPAVAYADEPVPTPDQGNCTNCHEDLYFLHDTGNWYCLKESPMSCVDCHSGDPLAISKEQAHVKRSAHPVLNDDTSKCQECHPQECTERLQIFQQNAGISEVLIAMPYTPGAVPGDTSTVSAEQPKNSSAWINIPILLLASVIWIAYILRKKRAA
jgi:hypothetical protein